MKRLIILIPLALMLGGCVRGKKACKANHKKIKKMRKRGQINM